MREVKVSMSAVETAREFCRAWFEKLDLDEVIAFLAEDITFVGTGEDEFVRGKPYVRQDISELAEPFVCRMETIHELSLTACAHSLAVSLTLKNSIVLTREEPGGRWQIRSLHVAEPGSSQRGEEHYPQTLVMERIARQRQELLNRKRQSGDLLRVHRHHRPAGGTGRGASSLQQYPGRGVLLPL